MAVRLTESRLRQIIREERARLSETLWPPGPRQMPKPRTMRTYQTEIYFPEQELEETRADAATCGLTVVSENPTGSMTDYYPPDDSDSEETEGKEIEMVLQGPLAAHRKFYYMSAERMGHAQSIEQFVPADMGVYPIRTR